MAMMMDTKKAHQCMRVGYPKQTPRDIPIMIMNIVAYHHSGTSLYLRIILDRSGVSKPEISLRKAACKAHGKLQHFATPKTCLCFEVEDLKGSADRELCLP